MEACPALSRVGLVGLGEMGHNLALNIAEKGFPISVYNRTTSKVDEAVHRAGNLPLSGKYSPRELVLSIERPRSIVVLVSHGAPVDNTIAALADHMSPGDTIIDGGEGH